MSVRILILGGTGLGRHLADRLVDLGYDVVLSLAGRTLSPKLPRGGVYRAGGFGGVGGLVSYLRAEGIGLLIDATHPFSRGMSAHAVSAGVQVGIGCIRLQSPPWEAVHGDDWLDAGDIRHSVALIPKGWRVFLPLGRQSLMPFLARDDIEIFARMIEPLEEVVPAHCHIVLDRPPFSVGEEIDFLRSHKITGMVVKNSGHGESYAKLEAARDLGIRVIMIRRPKKPPAETFFDIESLVSHLPRLTE